MVSVAPEEEHTRQFYLSDYFTHERAYKIHPPHHTPTVSGVFFLAIRPDMHLNFLTFLPIAHRRSE